MTANMVYTHFTTVLASILLTIVIGVPLGVCAYSFHRFRRVVLVIVEVMQTIPAMAMLGIIMVFLGAGPRTVITGLLLYSLLPVVQNTYVGLKEVSPAIKEVAKGMGMTRLYRLIHVEMPIAFPFILAGIRIAAVTAVGVAVFGSYVGGGGLGSVIQRGIRVQNMRLILTGTITLMAMAVSLDAILSFIEKRIRKRFSPH